ncbi:hypothetical protein SPTER_29340 [Sporomusa termitida]|uniref:Uncharacterized protein n=1 Tax=Sporomusa termitida TaxID=2377 RepID=A0A517DW25_9FIRM|nr:hypothetical protein SPTER_29340 [Sporomusa termitida]
MVALVYKTYSIRSDPCEKAGCFDWFWHNRPVFVRTPKLRAGIKVTCVYDANRERIKTMPATVAAVSPAELEKRLAGGMIDLVLETATQQAVTALAPGILQYPDIVVFSTTAFCQYLPKPLNYSNKAVIFFNSSRILIPWGQWLSHLPHSTHLDAGAANLLCIA